MSQSQVGFVPSVVRALSRHPAAVASVFEGRSTTASEILDRAARIASGLHALGVRDGERVAVLSANTDIYLQLYLAIPWAGGVLTPLNWRWSHDENTTVLGDCAPKVLFVSGDMAALHAALIEAWRSRLRIVLVDGHSTQDMTLAALADCLPMEYAGRAGEDLLAIFYTGGTTGRPKGVMLSHAGLIENCQAMRQTGLYPSGCTGLVVAPLFHLAAAVSLVMVMLAGGTAVIERAFHPKATLDAVAATKATDLLLVPTMIQMLLNDVEFDPDQLKSVERLVYGASPMQETTLDRIMTAAPHVAFTQAYGMTEVSCTATLLPPAYHVGAHREAGRHRAAGLPIPSTEVVVADQDGVPLPAGSVGEILVRGPGVMLGYWNQPDLTARALRDGWMHTGDGGRMDEDGLLYVVDRLKDMIVSGGENVYSAEVEAAIAQHPDVAQIAVLGVPDDHWGERVHAVIVARPGIALSADDVLAHCRSLIAGYKCPRSVEFRDALPMSAAGKILKADLRAVFWSGRQRNVA